jgi:hypothetical protein
MHGRLLAGLALAGSIAALVVVPMAQAAPHWYKQKKLLTAAPLAVATGGGLTLNAIGLTIKCTVTDTEEIWNPVGGGAGEDLVTAFALAPCKVTVGTSACPPGPVTMVANGLPWPSHLVSTGPPTPEIRDRIEKVRIGFSCLAGTPPDEFEGTLTPRVGVGKLIFGPGSGTLFDSSSNPMTVSGVDKLKAPPGFIRAKDP